MIWNEGDVVRKLRNAFGLTLEQMAAAAGVSLTAVNRLETGRTKEAKRGTLAAIAGVFGLSGQQLLSAIPPTTIEAALREEVRLKIERLRQEQRKAPVVKHHRRRAG